MLIGQRLQEALASADPSGSRTEADTNDSKHLRAQGPDARQISRFSDPPGGV
jgi:hypothetical protein